MLVQECHRKGVFTWIISVCEPGYSFVSGCLIHVYMCVDISMFVEGCQLSVAL